MSVHDRRKLPPFAWISLDSLRHLRRNVAPQRQQGARNALLGLAEAASLRHDSHHDDGDTLRELAGITGVSERRLRDHLAELEQAGLIRIEKQTDPAGRDLPTKYVLTDPPGSDESSDRGDDSDAKLAAKSSDPTRARDKGADKEKAPPLPPKGARTRDLDAYRVAVTTWAREAGLELPPFEIDVVELLAMIPPGVARTAHNVEAIAGPVPEDLAAAWQRIDSQLREAVPANTYAIWLEPLRCRALLDGYLVLSASSEIRSWVADRFAKVLERVVRDELGATINVHIATTTGADSLR